MGYESNFQYKRCTGVPQNSHVRVARHRSNVHQVRIEGLLLALLLFLREECRCVRHFARQFGALTLLGRGSGCGKAGKSRQWKCTYALVRA